MVNNGTLIPNVPIAVDQWRLPKSHEKFKTYLYFLSHLHTDHTQGLSSTWTQTIYTSSINRNLAIEMLKVKPQHIKVLEVGVTHQLFLPQEHGSDKQIPISVTLIDSNHIKGSVMFLFEGYFGRILCTGDFRINDKMLQNPILQNLAESKCLDALYVDNTFEEIGNDFKTREECLQTVIKIVKDHQYHRIIFGSQTIGKEDVLLACSQLRKEPVYVPDNILSIYKILEMPMENFTNDQTDSLLWYETLRKITEFDIKQKNVEMPTIAIRLTASGLLYKSEEKSDDGLIFCVPYSNHCSSIELKRFLDFLQPHKVERIVPKRPGLSVIDRYTFSKCEITMDESSSISEYEDSMAMLTDDNETLDKVCDPLATPARDKSKVLLPTETETMDTENGSEEEKENDSFSSPLSSQQAKSQQHQSAFAAAEEILKSIHLDLDRNSKDAKYIYTESFIEKLITLHKIYEPITGVRFQCD